MKPHLILIGFAIVCLATYEFRNQYRLGYFDGATQAHRSIVNTVFDMADECNGKLIRYPNIPGSNDLVFTDDEHHDYRIKLNCKSLNIIVPQHSQEYEVLLHPSLQTTKANPFADLAVGEIIIK